MLFLAYFVNFIVPTTFAGGKLEFEVVFIDSVGEKEQFKMEGFIFI